MEKRIAALAKHLGIAPDDISQSELLENCFDAGGLGDFLVLTDEEADEKTKEVIKDSLWAFNSEFIFNFLGLDLGGAKAFAEMQGKMCESCNDIVLSMLGDRVDDFIRKAILADGRGHFLSGYDGQEHESGEFFLYRV